MASQLSLYSYSVLTYIQYVYGAYCIYHTNAAPNSLEIFIRTKTAYSSVTVLLKGSIDTCLISKKIILDM